MNWNKEAMMAAAQERLKKEAELAATKGTSRPFFRIPEGVKMFGATSPGIRRLDILPTVVKLPQDGLSIGDCTYNRTIKVHYSPVGGGGVLCRQTVHEACPLCAAYQTKALFARQRDYWNNRPPGSEAAEYCAETSLYKPKPCDLYWVVNTQERESGVQLYRVTPSNFTEALQSRLSMVEGDPSRQNFYWFHSPTDGMTVVAKYIAVAGGFGRSYPQCNAIDFEPRVRQYTEEFAAALPSFDDLLILTEPDDMCAWFEPLVEQWRESRAGAGKAEDPVHGAAAGSVVHPSMKVPRIPEQPRLIPDEEPPFEASPPVDAKSVQEVSGCPHADKGYVYGVDTGSKPKCAVCPAETKKACLMA